MKLLLFSLCLIAGPGVLYTPHLAAQTQTPTAYGFPVTDAVQSFGFDKVDTLTGEVSLNIPLYSLPQKGPLKLSFSLRYLSYGSIGTTNCDDLYCNIYSGDLVVQPGVVPEWDQSLVTVGSYSQTHPQGSPNPMGGPPLYYGPVVTTQSESFVSDLEGIHTTVLDASDPNALSGRSIDGSGYLQNYNSADLLQRNSASATDLNGITYTNPFTSNLTGNGVSTVTSSEVIADVYGDSIVSSFTMELNNNVWSGTSTFVDSNGNNIPTIPAVPQAPDWLSLFGSSSTNTNSSTAGCPTLPSSVLYQPATSSAIWTPPSGAGAGTASYLFCYALIYVRNGLPVFDPFHFFANDDDTIKLQSVVLPDGTAWIFTYNAADPGNPNSLADGSLNGVILPTGGQISYTYKQHIASITVSCVNAPSNGVFGGGPVCGESSSTTTVLSSRTTNDGFGNTATWNYDIGTINYDTSITAVGYLPRISVSTTHNPSIQQPDGSFASNDVVDTYTGAKGLPIALQKEAIYQGSAGGQNSPIETTTSSYLLHNWFTGEIGTFAVASYLLSSASTAIPGVGTSVSTTHYDSEFTGSSNFITQFCYDPPGCASLGPEQVQNRSFALPLGVITSKSVTDFDGSTTLVSTNTTPWWTTTGGTASPYYKANLLSLPASVVTSGAGNFSETDYAYDENNGSPQGAYGNVTTASSIVNTGGLPLSKTTVYTSQGVPSQVTANGVVTQVNSFQCNGRYPLSTTVGFGTPVAETSVQQRDCTTGVVTSSTDPNGNLTAYSHNDPLNRLTLVSSALNTSAETHTKYVYASNETKVMQDQTTEDDGLLQTIQVSDGLGRVIRLLQPGGVIVDVQYDAIGHKASESNPYYTKADSTYDLTSYTYDALGRQLSATRASDGSANKLSFAQQNNTMSGLKSVGADALGVATTTYTDSLGRVSSVLDNLGNLTTYSYDGLSNLTGVSQTGSASLGEVSRVRTFKYDSLSRLLWANNPESGVICYGHGDGTVSGCNTNGYDSNGNLQSKTDARGVIVNYSYDALNRLLTKQYSNDPTGTAASCYQYDASSVAGAGGGLIGKLTNTWTQALTTGVKCPSSPPSTGVMSLHSFLSYDPMGRLTAERECTAASCGHISYAPRYTYDLAGDTILHSSGVPSGTGNLVFTNSYDTAGRLFTVTSSSTVLPTTLFTATQATSARGCGQLNGSAYSPAGGLQNAILGTGLQLTRSYDPRLRVSCEADIGNSALIPASGTVAIKINGTDQTH